MTNRDIAFAAGVTSAMEVAFTETGLVKLLSILEQLFLLSNQIGSNFVQQAEHFLSLILQGYF